ncbi:MAG: hypothetical protein IIA72_12550 [Proteobacteria bacterium]|nr:hypothetical protein [Pseudomonadota bacterium]
MPKPSISNPWFLSAAVALLAIALIAAPLDFTPPDWQLSKSAAQAKGGGGGGGGGGKGGSDNGRGHDKGNDTSSAKPGGKGAGKDNGKSANAKDNKGLSKAKNETQKRYAKALGLGVDGAGVKPGKSVHTFSHKQVKGLLGHKWKTAHFVDLNFDNHGERVSTMVAIAKALGYGAWVGAMQANFGTLQELQAAVDDAQSDVDDANTALTLALAGNNPAAIGAARQALEDAEADLLAAQQTQADPKPGLGPKGEWATLSLDADKSGFVDKNDLDEALKEPEP